MRTVLVTGGNGFIGGYVTTELHNRGYEVHVLDSRLRRTEPWVNLVYGDIRDATAVTEAAAHADGIIHLAGVLGTQETIANPRPAAETNILGGLNVLEAAAQYDLPIVNIAVGNYWMNNTYSITKNTVERFATMLARYRGARVTSVRALNAYGPRQSVAAPFGPSKVRKILPSFICRALSEMPIEIYGDGEQVMDMIFVGDVANVLVDTLEYTAANGAYEGTLEAGTGRATTVNDIARIIADEVYDQTGLATEIVYIPMRPGEDERSVVLGDPTTLDSIGIDHHGFLSFESGAHLTVDYFRNYLDQR